MGDKEDYLTSYRVFFENFAATVNPEDQLPVNIAGYTITESELAGEVLYWTTQYLSEKQCPLTLMTPLRRIILDEVRVASKLHPNEFGYKSDDAVYIALRLMQAVTARVNDVCLRYLDNSRLDTLPPPPPPGQRDLKTVSCATKNSRRVMEDRHVEIGNLEALFGIDSTEPTSFYAVYDGHAGTAAATYCAAHLHQYLVESPHFSTDLRSALRDCFLRTDAEFIRKGNQDRVCGGSTAVAVCVRGRRLVAAWAGDSLALLAKRMRLMQLVRPHKPGRQDERDRIESSGGTVMYWGTWRVNGQLAVSRAIGDAQYKPYVTARPEIATVELDGDEDFVVVACDGLWDFVSEDDVALSVYRQLAADPDDLKAVTKRLIIQAKRQGSADNISIIVVFLKDPRDIVADNCPPMDLGLDNAMVNAPPFAIDTEACKRQVDATAAVDANTEGAECADAEADAEAADNGVDNSDSDSEDLGPETAVDADDVDTERNHEPQPPTPPAHTVAVEAGHVDGALVDNVGESGDESEDEWNYFKGEGEREEQVASEEADDAPRSETPCQDNSAWESSSVDMNSSPLNPDAPVFVPGSVAGADVLLAESPRKPMPMDDIELPDVAQFQTEAVVRPADLVDLDNCDQLNGHHNVSMDEVKEEHLNGNDKCAMDSLGFGFNVGIEPDKVKDTALIQDFDRIQKDTTDFCNIQVFQTHTETNPFAVESNDELFERLKNKERDPMSMSFYQEKDDDTCERLSSKNESHVDLNAVQLLPDSDDEDIQANGVCDNVEESDKENISPDQHTDLFEADTDSHEPNNDIIRFDDRPSDIAHNLGNFGQGDNFIEYNTNPNNMDSFNIEFESSNIAQDAVLQTDTPESHKLMFEQIPEIPDGKSSELGFTNDEIQDPSESEKNARPFTPQDDTSQDIEMESKLEESPCLETQPEFIVDGVMEDQRTESQRSATPSKPAPALSPAHSTEQLLISPTPAEDKSHESVLTPEPTPNVADYIVATTEMIEQISDSYNDFATDMASKTDDLVQDLETEADFAEPPVIKLDTDHLTQEDFETEVIDPVLSVESPLPSQSPLPTEHVFGESPAPTQSPLPTERLLAASPAPTQSPLPAETLLPAESPAPTKSPLPAQSPAPTKSPLPAESPAPTQSPLPAESPAPTQSPFPAEALPPAASPAPTESPLPAEILLPVESSVPTQSPLPVETLLPAESPAPTQSLLPAETLLPAESPAPTESPLPVETLLPAESPAPTLSPLPAETLLPAESPAPTQSPIPTETLLAVESPAPTQSPLPAETLLPTESPAPTHSPLPAETLLRNESPAPAQSPLPTESPVPSHTPIPSEELARDSLLPAELALPAESPAPVPSPLPTEITSVRESPLPVESPVPNESPLPVDTLQPADSTALREPSPLRNEETHPSETVPPSESPLPTDVIAPETGASPLPSRSPLPRETSIPRESPAPVETVSPLDSTQSEVPHHIECSLTETEPPASPRPIEVALSSPLPADVPLPRESPAPAESPLPGDALAVQHQECRVPSPAVVEEVLAVETAPVAASPAPESWRLSPTPDAPEADRRAPSPPDAPAPAPDLVPEPAPRSDLVTDVDIGIPESRAQEICMPVTSEIQQDEAVLPPAAEATSPAPALDASAPNVPSEQPALGAELAIAAIAATALAAGVAVKSATKTTSKKSPTTPNAKPDSRTPKSVPKPTSAARTPASATARKPASTTPAARTPSAPKPISRTPASAAKPATPRPAAPATRTSSGPASKPTTPATKPTSPIKALAARAVAAPKPDGAAPKPKEGPNARAPAASRTAPTARPAAKAPAAKAPASARPAASKPEPIKRPAPRPATTALSAPKPATTAPSAPKPATTARPAPKPAAKPLTNGDVKESKAPARLAPRPAAPARALAAAPRPAPRAAAAPPTTKPAAPRSVTGTARPALDKQSKDLTNKRITAKAAPPRTAPSKTANLGMKKPVTKKPIESPMKEAERNGLSNGVCADKEPPSPPPGDSALLPDVIA